MEMHLAVGMAFVRTNDETLAGPRQRLAHAFAEAAFESSSKP